MVTRQPQVDRRTAKVRLSETDVLPLCQFSNVLFNSRVKCPRWEEKLSGGDMSREKCRGGETSYTRTDTAAWVVDRQLA